MTCPRSLSQEAGNLNLKASSDSLSSSGLPDTKGQPAFQQMGMGQGKKARMNNMTAGTSMGRAAGIKVAKLCWRQNLQGSEA